MKKHRILTRVLSVLFCLALCTQLTGCVQIPIPTLKPTPAPTPDKTYNDSLITEAYSVEGSFIDEYEETWDYAYHIPQLAADTADAAAINAEIMAYFGSDARAAQEGITAEGSRYVNWLNVSWESHWSGSLLSLSLCAASWLGDMGSRYFVYHYDFAAGQKLANAQVLDRVGVREADFTTALRRAAAQTFDAMYAPWGVGDIGPEDETFPSACIELAALRARTVQERNTGLETAVFYPNGDGTFTAYQPVGMVAGAGWYDREMTVKPGASEWAAAKAPSSAYGFVSAALTGDGASVRITKGKDGFFDSETSASPSASATTRSTPSPGATATIRISLWACAGRSCTPMRSCSPRAIRWSTPTFSAAWDAAHFPAAARSTVCGTSSALKAASAPTSTAAAMRQCTPWTRAARSTIWPSASCR